MEKTVHAFQIMNDSEIPGTIARTSTLPETYPEWYDFLEPLHPSPAYHGRPSRYTEMKMGKLYMDTLSYGFNSIDEVVRQLHVALGSGGKGKVLASSSGFGSFTS